MTHANVSTDNVEQPWPVARLTLRAGLVGADRDSRAVVEDSVDGLCVRKHVSQLVSCCVACQERIRTQEMLKTARSSRLYASSAQRVACVDGTRGEQRMWSQQESPRQPTGLCVTGSTSPSAAKLWTPSAHIIERMSPKSQ